MLLPGMNVSAEGFIADESLRARLDDTSKTLREANSEWSQDALCHSQKRQLKDIVRVGISTHHEWLGVMKWKP